MRKYFCSLLVGALVSVSSVCCALYPEFDDVNTYKLQDLAKQDDGKAQAELAYRYRSGAGVPKDYTVSLYWMNMAAKNNDPYACGFLSWYYAEHSPYDTEGRAPAPDLKKSREYKIKALKLWMKIGDGGDGQGYYKVASEFAFRGLDRIDSEIEFAKEYLIKAANLEYPQAVFELARCYWGSSFGNVSFEKNEEKAIILMNRAAELNVSEAKRVLARYYGSKSHGNNLVKAFTLYKNLADSVNDYEAISTVSNWYRYGNGTKVDYKKALEYSWKMIEHNMRKTLMDHDSYNYDPEYYIGEAYYKGLGVTKNNDKAMYWLKKIPEDSFNYSLAKEILDEINNAKN